MLGEIASQVVTTKDYPVPSPFTGGSRREETNMSEILDWQVFVLTRQGLLKNPFFYRGLPAPFEIDLSSVYPYFEPLTRTSLTEEFYEEILPEEMLEYDIVVRMPPRRRYTIELEIKGIRKAEPKIVEPEWI